MTALTQVDQIMEIFEGFRMDPTPKDVYLTEGKPILKEKLLTYVSDNKRIPFVMLGFPFKSTNTRDKVLGIIPDLAEKVTVENFESFAGLIENVYKPGAQVTVLSDGFMFNDILGVSEKTVYDYKDIVLDMRKSDVLKILDVNDFYTGGEIASKREKIVTQFGVSEEYLASQIILNPDVNYLYTGMVRFMMEELAPIMVGISTNQLQKEAKKLTRKMMFVNEAYSNLAKKEFAQDIRISMHPSVNNGSKYSFKLIPGNTRHSAWHSALVVGEDGYTTMHKKQAIEAGYELISVGGQPYYFQKS